jgi:hypothetical protein
MKKILVSFLIAIVAVSCSKNEEDVTIELQQKDPLSAKEINKIIETSLENNGDFEWSSTSAHTIWSAVILGDSILTIGYGTSDGMYAKGVTSETYKKEVLASAMNTESASLETLSPIEEEHISVVDIKIGNKETIERLLNSKSVRYLEPSGYRFFANNLVSKSSSSSSSGCGYDIETLASSDYTTIAPNAKMPWNFGVHNIDDAWNYSTGSGVTIGVIDTGLSKDQRWMNSSFNDGYSSGRTVQKYGTYVDSWWPWSTKTDGSNDKCGHGTSMASVATAPRNNDGLPVGVAYNANLVSYRATSNVILDGYHEQKGVAAALTALANRSDVKIISMSIGHVFSVGRIKDAIRYAHSRGKLIFAAGGTSTSFTTWYGVIFPASMSETVAVTGVKETGTSNCDVCHSGSKIDFTVAMERGSGNTVPVLSYYNGKTDYVGGSSVATATTAGIAALVWEKHPNWSRSQVLNKMKQSAEYYPNKSSEHGYGKIDALKAVQ